MIAPYKDYIKNIGKLLVRDSGVSILQSQATERLQQFVNDAFSMEMIIRNVSGVFI